jgi:hypothetical protein
MWYLQLHTSIYRADYQRKAEGRLDVDKFAKNGAK